jgi:aspartyl/asparaginyl beta-hydroxylase (cupin superfamily)
MIYIVLITFILLVILIFVIASRLPDVYNAIIYSSSTSKDFYTDQEKEDIFPYSLILEDRWEKIRDEYLSIRNEERKNVLSVMDTKIIGDFDDDFWEGWNMFPLRIFNQDHKDNMKKMPVLSDILLSSNNITSAYISVLSPGKVLPPHHGPFAGILRYHLGLVIPDEKDGKCYITVNNKDYYWKNGEGKLFDEMYQHSAYNNTNKYRVILFLDIQKPLPSFLSEVNRRVINYVGQTPKIVESLT